MSSVGQLFVNDTENKRFILFGTCLKQVPASLPYFLIFYL
jgi:hypothetical protein